ncbi:hypothetical protein PC111_g11631 [Phytophthora cactorum]|nr:hypothetical protein PC111_g11631 [Phytophthora cactorum]KAG2827358.1 hypothetical protein PC112_g8870 [Phytophthora cactorum]
MNPGLAVLKALASSCSVVMILSSAPSLYDIHKHHDTGDVALFPLVGLWLNCVMVLLYGWASGSYFPLFSTYVFGTIVSTAYVGVYFRWTKARAYAMKAIGAAFIANVLGSVQHDDRCLLVALRRAIRDDQNGAEDAIGCLNPRRHVLAGATSNLIWTIEGLFSKDMFILFLSAACSTLGFIQVALYLIFRPTKKSPAVDPSVTDVLPVKAPLTKLKNDICGSVAVALVPPRCGDKIVIVSPGTLVPVST